MGLIPKKQLVSHTLAETLLAGNTTGATHFIVSTTAEIQGETNLVLRAAAASNLSFAARSSNLTHFNQDTDLELNSDFGTAGLTSIIAAINGIQDGRVALPPGGSTLKLVQGTVDETGQTEFTMPDVVQAGFYIFVVNNIPYFEFEGWFTVSGADNEIWTWENQGDVGPLVESDRIAFIYFEA